MLNFKGGIKPDAHKYTKNSEIVRFPSPEKVKLCLFGENPCVSEGSVVKIGDRLTTACTAHSPVCGRVSKVADGHVTIESNGETEISAFARPFPKKLSDATREELLGYIKSKGICFDGTFLYEKLIRAADKAQILIVSCGETLPFSCTAYKTLKEKKREIIYGTKIIMRAVGVRKSAVTVEAIYRRDISELNELKGKSANIEIISHTSKYPAHREEILKLMFMKKFISAGNKLSNDDILVVSCEEAAALFEAFKSGLPMVERLVTVDGDAVFSPANIVVPTGVSVGEVLAHCNFEEKNCNVILTGDPICANEVSLTDDITKTSGTIIALSSKLAHSNTKKCISCGKCHAVCPMRLSPRNIILTGKVDSKCIACGCCSYICPARIDFSQIYPMSEVNDSE